MDQAELRCCAILGGLAMAQCHLARQVTEANLRDGGAGAVSRDMARATIADMRRHLDALERAVGGRDAAP